MNDFNLKKNKEINVCALRNQERVKKRLIFFKPISHFRVVVLNFRNEEKEQFLKSFGRFCELKRKKYISLN